MHHRFRQLAAIAVWAMGCGMATGTTGCASYTQKMEEPRRAVSAGDPEAAVEKINRRLKVEQLDERPADIDGENTLYLLERATLLQAMGHYESASRDMIAVDQRLEWLDIQSDTTDRILEFVYTDEAGPYRAPPHERLLLNAMNMVNFMARGEHAGARVEARRFDLLQRFFLDDGSRKLIYDVLGLGNYLAGAAFEAGGDYRGAVRFYTLAHLYGVWPEIDDDRLLDLIALTGYRGAGLGELRPEADELLERARRQGRIDRSAYRGRYRTGDTLVVVQTGLAPYRQAQRLSVMQALDRSRRSPYVSVHITPSTHQQAVQLYGAGVLTWLNTSTLSRHGLPPRRTPRLTVGHETFRLIAPLDIGAQVEEAWQAVNATALAAAISRAVVRAVAGRATQEVTQAAARQSQALAPYAGVLGWVSRIALQASLAARDTPDTRSWTSLPEDIYLVRFQLDPGEHELGVSVGNNRDTRRIDIGSDRFQLVNFSRLR